MKITGAFWVIHFPEGKTNFGDSRAETDNFHIANTLLGALESSGETAVPREIRRDINDLNWDLCDSPWRFERLAPDPLVQIPIGAHLVSSRTLYSHHGIYVGDGRVVHYSGYPDYTSVSNGEKPGCVEEVSVAEFANGNGYFIKIHESPSFIGERAVDRARSRIGESLYSIFMNNCEHFCEWCINGKHHSHQVANAAVGMSRLSGDLTNFRAFAADCDSQMQARIESGAVR